MAKAAGSSNFHIAMFPWFAYGHITPYLYLSNKLAERGHKISFLLPKKAQLQLQSDNPYPNLIHFYALTVPYVDGLPPGTETASDIPFSLSSKLAVAMDLTRDQVESLITTLNPDFVFYDLGYWIPEITSRLGIKSVYYSIVSASTSFSITPERKISRNKPITEDEHVIPPPCYPSRKIVLRRHEVKKVLFMNDESGIGLTFYERVMGSMKNSDAIAIRTCSEIEGQMRDYLASQFKKPVMLTGPALPAKETKGVTLEYKWAKWLGEFEPGSVIFCAFGTQYTPEKNQFQELMLGFELTGLPFFVALKPPPRTSSIEEALPEGFEDRVKERGVVHGGWVQQTLILNHPSVGCFVSHCGFGSMLESLMSDCQIVLAPYLVDQILNTRLLAEELKVGVEVEREENDWISKENLCKAIKSVMDKDSEIGSTVRENHFKLKEVIGRQEFMDGYIDNFVENLRELKMT